jgi:hypothetical protein
MSHFSVVQSKIKDRNALVSALRQLNLEFEEATDQQLLEMYTRWSDNQKHLVNLLIRGKTLDSGADIGFKLVDGSFQIIADTWEIERSKMPNFRKLLTEEYTVQVAVKSGYRVISRTTAVDGRMQIELEQQQQVQTRR